MTKKSATRRKRSAPASIERAKRKQQTVAVKKKHMEQFDGKKRVVKATTSAAHRVKKKTPLEIAHEILVKNGYLPSASHVPATTTSAPLVTLKVDGTSTSGDMLHDTNAYNVSPSSSLETLTKEQLRLIEMRRQEALARRRRAQQANRAQVYSLVVTRPDSTEDLRRGLSPVIPPPVVRMASSRSAVQPKSNTHCEDTFPTTNQRDNTNPARPQCFWDDLEAAAEIVQWENEQMAEVTLEHRSATTATNFDQAFGTVQHESRRGTKVETASTRPPAVASLSQELLAAAEIIQWEKENEGSPEAPAFNKQCDSSGSDHELDDAPQFQLLPVQFSDDCEPKLPESVRPHDSNITSCQDPEGSNSQPESKAHRKHPLVAPLSSDRPHSSAISSTATSEEHHSIPASSYSSLNQRDPTTEFIDKHLLENKLEFPVLEFLDMMLA